MGRFTLVLDDDQNGTNFCTILHQELNDVGIRLNKERPKISVTKTHLGKVEKIMSKSVLRLKSFQTLAFSNNCLQTLAG